ncbi:MAG: ATP-grasp domain-containing protein [Candidatus Kapabacteria bacterium]|nr:ATP-grasp domain-containing protein [Candidatus Kapabacteria bacterium]
MSFDPQNMFVWVLAPMNASDDANVQYYNDYSQSIGEYTRVFDGMGAEWKWLPVWMNGIGEAIATILNHTPAGYTPLALNLCDGDEVNGTPGISVIRALREAGITTTGADEYYYAATTSKAPMKTCFDEHGVTTPPWRHVMNADDAATLLHDLGAPLILKPAVSGGSMGLGVKNVVEHQEDCAAVMQAIAEGYHGWKLDIDGVIAERFIAGREYTTLVVTSPSGNPHYHHAVERVFHPSLAPAEQFLSFDRLWETYDEEQPMSNGEFVFEYAPVAADIDARCAALSIAAYNAVGGTGYGRIDIRHDTETDTLYVLEVNAQCGLSEDENYTSIGAILRYAGVPYASLIRAILDEAVARHTTLYAPSAHDSYTAA